MYDLALFALAHAQGVSELSRKPSWIPTPIFVARSDNGSTFMERTIVGNRYPQIRFEPGPLSVQDVVRLVFSSIERQFGPNPVSVIAVDFFNHYYSNAHADNGVRTLVYFGSDGRFYYRHTAPGCGDLPVRAYSTTFRLDSPVVFCGEKAIAARAPIGKWVSIPGFYLGASVVAALGERLSAGRGTLAVRQSKGVVLHIQYSRIFREIGQQDCSSLFFTKADPLDVILPALARLGCSSFKLDSNQQSSLLSYLRRRAVIVALRS